MSNEFPSTKDSFEMQREKLAVAWEGDDPQREVIRRVLLWNLVSLGQKSIVED